jgi:AraC family transcriptional activator of pobA
MKESIEFEKKAFVTYHDFKDDKGLSRLVDDSYAVVLFDTGNGLYSIDTKECQVKSKQIQMLSPNLPCKWKLQTGTTGQTLIIKKALFETFSSKLQFSFSEFNQYPAVDLDTTTYKKVNVEFLSIKKELSAKTVFLGLVNARCRLITLMITLWMEHKFGDLPVKGSSSSLAHKFHALIDQHFKTQKSVAFYAKHLHITPNYLGIISRKQYRMSASEFIQERILLEAKRLLHSSDRSIKEIAFNLGFKTQAHFSSFFKIKTNLTPSEYKNMIEES